MKWNTGIYNTVTCFKKMVLVAVLGTDCMRQWINQGFSQEDFVAIKVRNNVFSNLGGCIRVGIYSIIMHAL